MKKAYFVFVIIITTVTLMVGCSENKSNKKYSDYFQLLPESISLAKDGNLFIYSSDGSTIPIDDKGRFSSNYHKEPITTLFLMRNTKSGVEYISRVQLIHRWQNVNSLANRKLPTKSETVNQPNYILFSPDPKLSEAPDSVMEFVNNIGKYIDDKVKDLQETAAKVSKTSAEIIEDIQKKIGAQSMVLGYVTSKGPLLWTQQKPLGVGAFKFFHHPILDFARTLVQEQTKLVTASIITSKAEYWELVNLVLSLGLASKSQSDWDNETQVLNKAEALAKEVAADLEKIIYETTLTVDPCIGPPSWEFTKNGANITMENFCANLFYASATGLKKNELKLFIDDPRPLYRVVPSISIWDIGASLVELVTEHDLHSDNGLRQLVSQIRPILSLGYQKGWWGKKTSWPIDQHTLRDIRAAGDKIIVKWDNGFFNDYPNGTITVRVMPWALPVAPSYFTDSRGKELVFSLVTDYELTGDGAKLISNKELVNMMEKLVEETINNPSAHRALIINSLLLNLDEVATLIDAGKLILDVADVPLEGLPLVIAILLDIFKSMATSDVILTALVEYIDTYMLGDIQAISSFYIYSDVLGICVMSNQSLSACQSLAENFKPFLSKYVPKEKYMINAGKDFVENILKVSLDMAIDSILELAKKPHLEKIMISIIGHAATKNNMSIDEVKDAIMALKKINTVKNIISAVDFTSVLSDVETVTSESLTLMMNKSRGEYDFGTAFCSRY